MATKKDEKVELLSVQIPEIKVKKAKIKIQGDSPLIINKFSEKAKREILEKQMKKAKKPQKTKVPFADFVQSLHWLTDMPKTEEREEDDIRKDFEDALKNGAKFGFPSVGVKQSAISAAYRNGIVKNKVCLQGAFHITGEFVEIQGTLKMREDYVKIPMGGADVVFRGEFETGWTSEFIVSYNESVISLEQLIQIINMGGYSVGIGDWRVEKGGNNGMFHVV